ncbi:MAG: hypothetical protein WC781_04310 [Candidatus Pacearchaeota archaeon]|jgi:hypothetical protein
MEKPVYMQVPMIDLVDLNKRPKQPLDYIGGFESYQQKLYSVLSEKIAPISGKDTIDLDKHLNLEQVGFEGGLISFLVSPKYITSGMITLLECPLNLSLLSLIPEFKLSDEERSYWKSEMNEARAFCATAELTPELYITLEAINDSDKIAKEKNSKYEAPKFNR